MKKTSQIKRSGLTKLKNSEHSEFHANVHKYLEGTPPENYYCTTDDLDGYKIAFQTEEDLLCKQSISVLTSDVDIADVFRDKSLSYFFSQVDSIAKSINEEQKEAGRKLKMVIKSFRGITNKALSEENAEVKNLIKTLNTTENKELIKKIPNLSETITTLTAANQEVIDLMSQRTSEARLKAESRKKRNATNEYYNYLVQYINATMLIHPTPEIKQIITEINNLIDRTNNVYNIRRGVISAQNKKDKENKSQNQEKDTAEKEE